MTEDSVMLSLKELTALEERRVFEEEECKRLAHQAERQAIARAEETARRDAEREQQQRAAAAEARDRAEREQQARECAIREAELLKAKLGAEADLLVRERSRLAAEVAAVAAEETRVALVRSKTRVHRGLIAWAGAATLASGLSLAFGSRASRQNDDKDRSLAVLSATLMEERAISTRLGGELAKREQEKGALARAVEEARQATLSAQLADRATDKPSSANARRSDPRVSHPAPLGVGVNSGTCDPLDPLCGFKK